MVCLNKNILFNKLKLRDNLKKEIYNTIKLELELELDKIIIERINKVIHNRIYELFESDHFIYLNMSNDVCSHKYKKGKMDGNFCHKKITKNGCKKNYVCTKHNKNHIPKQKINITIKQDYISENNDKHVKIDSIDEHNKLRILKKSKINFKNKKRYKKISLGYCSILNLNNILKSLKN